MEPQLFIQVKDKARKFLFTHSSRQIYICDGKTLDILKVYVMQKNLLKFYLEDMNLKGIQN